MKISGPSFFIAALAMVATTSAVPTAFSLFDSQRFIGARAAHRNI